ncbi:MAG: sulfatase-like hydrolase/transferase, partial [Draconibacterium sp.]|nr:sulfatase-like hydrolase/transferase [Draconibacterium sp.]
IVVLWSDHGYRMGEKGTFAKHCLWEPATRAPLIFSGMGIEKGKIVDAPAEMLSIYPTLLEMCRLPEYKKNEGISLGPILKGKTGFEPEFALTTYGWGNHGIKTKNQRYIRYQDGSEEFYNHNNDPNEWYNLAGKNDVQDDIENLKKYLPKVDVPYTKHSVYTFTPWFRADKVNHSE